MTIINKNIIACLIVLSLFTSCDDRAISSTWSLIDRATLEKETIFDIPMGFTLKFTDVEFEERKEQLKSECTWFEKYNDICYKTTELSGDLREVRISFSPYFSTPNTKTDKISSISFMFDEFRSGGASGNEHRAKNLIKKISNQIFDSSWKTKEFRVNKDKSYFADYYKFWIKKNIVAELNYTGDYLVLRFFNMPKSGSRSIKDNVNRIIDSHKKVKNRIYKKSKIRSRYKIN